tara:strand:+ start:97 stop:297 length:201 start_codon:yes stop_codon:yes gene_type:complete
MIVLNNYRLKIKNLTIRNNPLKAIDLKNGLLTKIFNLFLISGNLFLNSQNITNNKIKINIVLIILN